MAEKRAGRKCGGEGLVCTSPACKRCGWNPEEGERRRKFIRAGLLGRDKNGLARLAIWRRKEDDE